MIKSTTSNIRVIKHRWKKKNPNHRSKYTRYQEEEPSWFWRDNATYQKRRQFDYSDDRTQSSSDNPITFDDWWMFFRNHLTRTTYESHRFEDFLIGLALVLRVYVLIWETRSFCWRKSSWIGQFYEPGSPRTINVQKDQDQESFDEQYITSSVRR